MRNNEGFAFLLTLSALILGFVAGGLILVQGFTESRGFNCGSFSVTLQPEEAAMNLQRGKGQLIKVKLTNVGVEDEYRITVKKPDWAMVKPFEVRPGQGESSILCLYISPAFYADGRNDVVINLKSNCIDEDFKIPVFVE